MTIDLDPRKAALYLVNLRRDLGESEDRAISRIITLGPVWACRGTLMPRGYTDYFRRHTQQILRIAYRLAQGHPEATYAARAIRRLRAHIIPLTTC